MERGAPVILLVITACASLGLLAGLWWEMNHWEWLVIGFPILLGILFLSFFAKKYLIYLTSALIPLSASFELPGGISIQFPAELLVGLLALIFLSYVFFRNDSLNKDHWFHPISIWVIVDLLFGLLAVINSELPFVSLKRWGVKIAFALVFFFMIGHWFSDKRDYTKIILTWCGGMLLVVMYTLWQHGQYRFGIPYAPAMPRPFYDDHTIYGANLALFLPLLCLWLLKGWKTTSGKTKWGLVGFIFLLSAGIFFSFSRAVWLSLITVFGFIGLWELSRRIRWNRTRLLSIITVSIVMMALVATQGVSWIKQNRAQSVDASTLEHFASSANIQTNTSNRERINRWVCALRLFEERPMLGWGPGTYQHVYGPFQKFEEMTRISTYQGNRGNAHSEYLTYLSESGLIGLLGFLGLIFVTFYRSMSLYHRVDTHDKRWIMGILAGLSTFLLHGFFNSFLDQIKIAGIFYVFLAILVTIDLKNRALPNSASDLEGKV